VIPGSARAAQMQRLPESPMRAALDYVRVR
jgi:hypothetical protein